MSPRVATWPAWSGREWWLAAGIAITFVPAAVGLAAVWSEVDYLQHGFLIPLVSLWALLRERPRRARLAVRPDPRGAVALGVALLAYLAGLAGGSVTLQGVALVGAVAGAVWFARGLAWLRSVAFPVGFLLFMVPPPPSWITPVIVRLQLFVSSASLALLHGVGVDVARDGNVLLLSNGDALFVAEACSGVTSIITLTPLAVFLAYFTLRRPLARVLLVAAVVPLAMAGNLARVVATVLASERMGAAEVTGGPLHQVFGLLAYLVACGLLLATGAALRRAFGRR